LKDDRWYSVGRHDTGERIAEIPRPVTVHIDEAELEPASQEDMERRRLVASRLRSLLDRPITDAEREFWREFEAELEKERLTFR
jgi:hypothetical protein